MCIQMQRLIKTLDDLEQLVENMVLEKTYNLKKIIIIHIFMQETFFFTCFLS